MGADGNGELTRTFFNEGVAVIDGRKGVIDSVREAAFNDGSRPNLIGGGKPAGFRP